MYRNHGCESFVDDRDFWRSTALGGDGGRSAHENTLLHGGGDTEGRWKITRSVTGKFDTIRVTKTSSVFERILLILGATTCISAASLVG